jgi:hypothetical protein
LAVSLRPLYLILQHLLGLLLLIGRTSSAKNIKLLVLRHELAVLRRTNPSPSKNGADRAAFAAFVRRRPPECAAIAWPPQTPSCAGIARSCARDGPTRIDLADRRHRRRAGRTDGDTSVRCWRRDLRGAQQYNMRRPHRGMPLHLPRPQSPVPEPACGKIQQRRVLGELINEYESAA